MFVQFISNIFTKRFWGHALYIAALLAIISFTIFGDSGLYKLHFLTKQRKEIKHQISENKIQIESLKNQKKQLIDPVYLESIIRNELGYIKEGEVIFSVTEER